MVWFARHGGMCAKVGGGVWLGVRLLRVCGSVMESPWLCCVEFAGRQARVCILSGGRCEWAGLFVVGDRIFTTALRTL
jgi:hypothetical protein